MTLLCHQAEDLLPKFLSFSKDIRNPLGHQLREELLFARIVHCFCEDRNAQNRISCLPRAILAIGAAQPDRSSRERQTVMSSPADREMSGAVERKCAEQDHAGH